MPSVPSITLNNGVEIPQLGFGTFQIDPEETAEAVTVALDMGYRHIDTAEMYGNEKQVGQAVLSFDIDRSEVFVTSKLNNGYHDPDDARRAFDQTLEDLGFDYLDLFLIHWPMPDVGDFVDTWRAMEEILESGRCKSIGVSNFNPHHLQRLFDADLTVPAVNQIEVHPYFTQDEVRAFDAQHGIATEAWSPIAQGEVTDDDTLCEIGESYGRSAAQVTLRWHIQRGDIVFPKSTTPERVAENFDLFDFELTADEVDKISALNCDKRMGPDPDEFNQIP